MKKCIFAIAVVAAVLTACADDNNDAMPVAKGSVDEKVRVELVLINSDGKSFEKVDNKAVLLRKAGVSVATNYALRFKDEAAFSAAIREFEHFQFAPLAGSEQSLTGVKLKRADSTPIALPSQFRSLEDVYIDALKEAESYYERVGGYEEFKAKYNNLYFPEKENDYSAFRPVSSKAVAQLVNPDGYVVIGDKVVDKKDIFSYSQLEKLGLTMPKEDSHSQLRSGAMDVNKLSTKYNERRDRKLWVNVQMTSILLPNTPNIRIPMLEIEVCFRKKGILGVWYNYWSQTSLVLRGSITGVDSKSGYSSHDYRTDNYGRLKNINTTATVEYRGIPGTFDFVVYSDANGYIPHDN